MSVVQIPNLGAAIALNGTELLEGVQAGTSVKLTVAQLGAYITAQYPPPGVSSVATSAPITGGTITTTGTIGLAGAGVTNYYLANSSVTFNGVTVALGSSGVITGLASTSIAVGTTTVLGATSGYVLYDNAGVLGELATTGSGSVVRASSPTLVTPDLGTPSAALLTNATGLPLTTGVTGTLPAANGGTAQSTYATGDTLYASALNTLSKLTIGSTGQVLTVAGGVPTWATSTGGVTSFSAGTTGLTPSGVTTGAIVLAGTLGPANGGTGVVNNAASTITITGAYSLGMTLTGATSVTLPTSGTLATTAQLAAYLPLAGGTMVGDILFTDNLYDIGKSGATRPRDGYFSRVLSASVATAENGMFVNKQTVAADYTIATNYNAMSAGPVTVNSGITVTVSSGSTWAVV